MASFQPRAPAAPRIARRRAGPASRGGRKSAVAAPALADALAPKSHGSSCRASCHTGIAVSAISVPVYVASGPPARKDTASATTFTGLRIPRLLRTAAVVDAPPETKSTHEPTLIGEVTLKTRSMFRKRSGRPRSEIRRIGDTASAAAPT